MVRNSAFINGATTGAVVVTVIALAIGSTSWTYLAWLIGTSLVCGIAWHARSVRRAWFAHERAYRLAVARRLQQR
jgi:hypothetical protein